MDSSKKIQRMGRVQLLLLVLLSLTTVTRHSSVWAFSTSNGDNHASSPGRHHNLCETRRKRALWSKSQANTLARNHCNQSPSALCLSSNDEIDGVDIAVNLGSPATEAIFSKSRVTTTAAVDGSKRKFLHSTMVLLGTLTATSSATRANAASEVRAPLELLLPATRIQVYLEQAITICQSIVQAQTKGSSGDGSATTPSASAVLEPLKAHFEKEPTTFLTPSEEKLAQRYLEIKTGQAWQRARLAEREERWGAEQGIDYTKQTLYYNNLNKAFEQWGKNNQFQILRSRQRQMEQANAYRKAFNAYTNNLVFGNSYQLNVQGAEKKALIRNDALPDVNSVVVSDLDLRDLYRNQVLQNVDDAKAELDYQLSLKPGDDDVVDANEILEYLLAAQTSCNKWFGFIPQEDVQAALQTVQAETF